MLPSPGKRDGGNHDGLGEVPPFRYSRRQMNTAARTKKPPANGFRERPLPPWQRAVVKIGSSLLAGDEGLSARHALRIGHALSSLLEQGRELIVVSSGAVAAGRDMLRARAGELQDLPARQALAALGQTRVVALWQRFFDRPVAQVLLTHDDLRNRRRYLNARATLRELLLLGAIPVINENDTVAVDELKLGDNDNLAAHVAMLVEADLLVLLTDIDGLYDADPRRHADARPIQTLPRITAKVRAMAGGAGSGVGTGGMATKLEAAARAADAGIATAILNGSRADAVDALARDRLVGTYVRPASSQIKARKAWLKNSPLAPGRIVIDAGAARALGERGASLLARGVVAVDGEFARGDVIEIASAQRGGVNAIARGLAQYGAGEIRRVLGARSDEIAARLGYTYGAEIVHRDDLALLVTRRAR